jgi:hypothetical protein
MQSGPTAHDSMSVSLEKPCVVRKNKKGRSTIRNGGAAYNKGAGGGGGATGGEGIGRV